MRRLFSFTLLEICLAIFVFILTLVGLLLFYLNSQEFGEIFSSTLRALWEAQKMLETIRGSPFSSIYATYNNHIFDVSGFAPYEAKGVVYVEREGGRNDLLRVRVVICFRAGRRIVGEDLDLDGVLDAGEDVNGNGRIDSPVELVTLVTSRY